MSVLFVNACLRDEESRTLQLCHEYLEGMHDIHEVNLGQRKLQPLYKEEVAFRSQLERAQIYDDPIFDLSKQFAHSDEIVIGAPYWDLSFPAALKTYIEHVSVNELTFHYTEKGTCEGLCIADHLTYITTCGGSIDNANYGYEYLCGIAEMFGIPEVRLIYAELLDVKGIDVDAQLERAREQIRELKGIA